MLRMMNSMMTSSMMIMNRKIAKNAIFLFKYILHLVNSSAIIYITTKDISCYVNIKTASVYVTVYHLLGKLSYKLIFIMNIL